MLKFGLLGYPIAHSGSPRLFAAAYPSHFSETAEGDNRWTYDLVEKESFDDAWETFLAEYQAVNVTAPFKEKAAAAADILSPEVEKIGAANILVKTPEGVKAYNSDYRGLLELIKSTHVKIETALVVGYGGAGMAAVQACRDLGIDVVICNRTAKAEGVRPLDEVPIIAEVADLLIYALPMAIDCIPRLHVPVILEANYRTRSFDAAEVAAMGGIYIPGDEWLKAQAETGYEIMSGEKPAKL